MSEDFSIMLCIFPLVSVVVTGVGIWLWLKTRRFLSKAIKATGTVVGKEYLTSSSDKKGTNYANFQFTTREDEVVTGRSIVGVPWAEKNKGEEIDILYDPDNPEDSRVDSFVELHGPTLIFLLVGIGQFIVFWIVLFVEFLL